MLTPLDMLMLLGLDINAASQKTNQPKIKHSRLSDYNSSVPISNNEVKNIGSSGFIQLVFVRTLIKG